MATQRPLSRPPVREAIVAVRTEPVSFQRVTELRERLADAFPVARPYRMESIALNLPDDAGNPQADSAATATGWRCESADGAQVALIGRDGVSFGRIGGYPGWTHFVERFLALWQAFEAQTAPVEIARISLRFVNDLRLPVGDTFHFERYLTTSPRVPAGMPQEILDFLVQMTLPGGGDGLKVAVTQATEAGARTGADLPVIVDIDASYDRPIPVDSRLGERMGQTLETLRDLKNRTFFGLVTEELVSAYE